MTLRADDQMPNRMLILLGLAFGVCITSGFARFAYGLILPSMRDDLGWGFTQAGWINTANALGYLLSAVVSVGLFRRFPQERLFAWGVVLTTLTLVASGLTRDFWVLSFWRFASGVFAAPVFIAAGALASNLFGADQRRNAMSIALTFGGGGLGMVLAALAFPPLFAIWGHSVWPVAWLSMGVASVVMAPLSLWAARQLHTPVRGLDDAPAPLLRTMRFEMAGYFMFAVGYIVYLTFLSAWMRTLGAGPWMVSLVWCIVGICTLLSSFVWRGLIGRFQSGVPLALTNACVAVAILLPVVFPTIAGLLVSSALFGLTVFMPPTSVTSFIRQNNPPDTWGRLMSIYTVLFAVGQCIGPIAAGLIGDAFDNIGYGLIAAAGILAVGSLCGALQRRLESPAAMPQPSS